jgi:sRNA-binding carbon storage regulator CsrA
MEGLTVTRKHGESIEIMTPEGRRIVVTVCPTNGSQVRLNVVAERAVSVMRSELLV